MNKKLIKALTLLTLVFSSHQYAGVMTIEGTLYSRYETIDVYENGVQQYDQSYFSFEEITPAAFSLRMEFDFATPQENASNAWFDEINGYGNWTTFIYGTTLSYVNPFSTEFAALNQIVDPNNGYDETRYAAGSYAYPGLFGDVIYEKSGNAGFSKSDQRTDTVVEDGIVRTYSSNYFEMFDIFMYGEENGDYTTITPPTFAQLLQSLLNGPALYYGVLSANKLDYIVNESEWQEEFNRQQVVQYYGDFTMSFDASAEERALLTANPVSEPSVFALLMLSGLILYRRK